MLKKLSLLICLMLLLPLFALANRHKADDIKPVDLSDSLSKAEFNITAAIYFGTRSETRIPVIADFYLFDHSVVQILRESGFNPVDFGYGSPLIDEEPYLEAVTKVFTDQNEENTLLADLISDSFREKRTDQISTNLFGFGWSGQIKSGSYYVFGIGQVGTEVFVWNFPVCSSGKINEIEIGQYNAEKIIPAVSPQINPVYYKYSEQPNPSANLLRRQKSTSSATKTKNKTGEEAREAISFFSDFTDFNSLKLYKLPGEIALTAPEYEKSIITTGKSAVRLKKASNAVFKVHHLQNYLNYVLLDSIEPNVFTYKLKSISLTLRAVEILTDDELKALVAHEVGHLYFAAELAAARKTKNHRLARVTELKCDVIALLTLKSLTIPPSVLIEAIEKLSRAREQANLPVSSEQSPSIQERKILADMVIKRFGNRKKNRKSPKLIGTRKSFGTLK